MRNISAITATICLPLLVGCATPYSETPLATNFPTSKQQKLQAAAHWSVIAEDVAKQIVGGIKEKKPLYINQAVAGTTFDRAFRNLLVSALIAEGFSVHKTSANALSVDIDTQAVRFSANRPQYKSVGLPTALATGVWALHDATAGAVMYAGIAAADAYSWFHSEFAAGEVPQTEIIVTTSVSDADRYLARSTSVYYVADADSGIYTSPPAPRVVTTKDMEVTGR